MKTLIVGLQYGDEGKGRVSAYFSEKAQWAVRFNGGPNAGHTVYVDNKKYALHHLPAGAVLGKKVALDAGMVIDFQDLEKEILHIHPDTKIYISKSAHLISSIHRSKDSQGSGIGSTKKGIAYCYSDKILRIGNRVGETQIINECILYEGLPPIEKHENAIYESAQGIMLDIEYGCYPYVTSSSIFPTSNHKIDKTIGVMKAYTSRVGDGPPFYECLEWLTQLGGEYGTTTGRPRRCTWLIEDEIDYAIGVAQPDEIVLTKLDILNEIDKISVWIKGSLYSIGRIDSYKSYLLEKFPSIKYISTSPFGDLEKV